MLNEFKDSLLSVGILTGSLVAFSGMPAEAASFTIGDTTVTLGSLVCEDCVDLESAGYDLGGDPVLTATESEPPNAMEPGMSTNPGDNVEDLIESGVESYTYSHQDFTPGSFTVDGIAGESLGSEFSFYWGSVDTYNSILVDGLDEITGDMIAEFFIYGTIGVNDTSSLLAGAGNYDFDVLVTLSQANNIDSVEFSTDELAFEVAALKQVPEPVSFISFALLGGIASAGLLQKSKRVS